jgi:hypothetical protein
MRRTWNGYGADESQRGVALCDIVKMHCRGHLLIMWSIELVCGTERKVKENEPAASAAAVVTHRDTQHTQRLIMAIRERPLMVLVQSHSVETSPR